MELANLEALIQRGQLALEDGDFAGAFKYFDSALNLDAKNADCYLGLLLCNLEMRKVEDLEQLSYSIETNPNYQKVLRFGSAEMAEKLRGYQEAALARIAQAAEAQRQAAEAARLQAEEARKQAEAAKQARSQARKKKLKKWLPIGGAAIAAIIGIFFLLTLVILPSIYYNQGMSALDRGDYKAAHAAFYKANGYKDAKEQYKGIIAVYQKAVLTYPDGSQYITDYTYDTSGNCIKEVCTWSSGSQEIYDYTYDTSGNCIKKVYTYTDGDQYIYDYTYDTSGNCIKEVHTLYNGSQYIYDYTYDQNGNCIKEVYTGSYGGQDITDYTYDQNGNCIKAVSSWFDGRQYIIDYTYDQNGNCIKRVYTESDGGQHTYDYSDFLYFKAK